VNADDPPLLTAVAQALERDVRLSAAFLTGSHASGRADRFSDVDVLLFAEDGATEVVTEDLPGVLNAATEIVDASSRPIGLSRLVNCVLATGERIDIVVAPLSTATTTPRWGPIRVLFDRSGVEGQLPPVSAPFRVDHDDEWLLELTRGFLRTLLLLPMLVERGELLRGAQHVQLCKQDLLELLLYRAGDPPLSRPGMWAWSELSERLPEPLRRLVEDLPPAAATVEGVIEGHLAVAGVYLRIAKETLPRNRWPAAYEDATLGFLARGGYELP
jgi:predicted nucleotidyltransferase